MHYITVSLKREDDEYSSGEFSVPTPCTCIEGTFADSEEEAKDIKVRPEGEDEFIHIEDLDQLSPGTHEIRMPSNGSKFMCLGVSMRHNPILDIYNKTLDIPPTRRKIVDIERETSSDYSALLDKLREAEDFIDEMYVGGGNSML